MDSQKVSEHSFKHLERAQIFIDIAQWREALHELDKHLEEYPDDYFAVCQSSVCHLSLRDYQAALDATKQAVALSPDDEWAYRLQSNIFTDNGEWKRALDAAKLCIEKDPNSPYSVQCLFFAQANCDAFDDAAVTLKQLHELWPDRVESHTAAGYLAQKRNYLIEAEEHYLDALKLGPESADLFNNMGVVYLEMARAGKGQHYQKKSVEMFERALELEPTFKLARNNISNASDALGKASPIWIIFALWAGSVILARIILWALESEKVTPPLLQLVSPIDAQPLLTIGNMLFLISAIATAGVTIYLFTTKSPNVRSKINYQFTVGNGWAGFACLYAAITAIYGLSFSILKYKIEAFSGFAFSISIIVTFFAITSFVITLSRRSKDY